MATDIAAERIRLPDVFMNAMWHPKSGLITSSFTRSLPLETVDDPSSKKPSDFFKPRLLEDSNVYLACYPRVPIFRSPLFSVLKLRVEEIPALIHEVTTPGRPPQFSLEPSVCLSWTSLEQGLLTSVEVLLKEHPLARQFPPLSYPRYPYQFGYQVAHVSRERAISCAKRARGAFHSLCALLTFSLTIWLTEYEDDCFDKAFKALAAASSEEIPRVWIDQLQNSVICDLSIGAHPGGFLDGYKTLWGQFFHKFCRARIPIWVLWGIDNHGRGASDAELYKRYFPPKDVLLTLRSQSLVYGRVVLPTYLTSSIETQPTSTGSSHLPASSQHSQEPAPPRPLDHALSRSWNNPTPPDPFLHSGGETLKPQHQSLRAVHAGSGQRSGETWEEFAARMEKGLDERKRMETDNERKSRLSLEAHAMKHGFSVKSRVFLWEQDEQDPSFYRRTLLNRSEVEANWEGFTERQRRYWSHKNQWDLCPQIPPHASAEMEFKEQARIEALDDEDDEDHSLLYSKPSKERLANALLESVRAVIVAESFEVTECWYEVKEINIVEYLRKRHGFHADLEESWNPSIHGKKPLRREQHQEALKHLLHDANQIVLPTSTVTSIVDFHNTARSEGLSYTKLPAAWDMSRSLKVATLVCNMSRLLLERVTCRLPGSKAPCLYILRPPQGSNDPCPWFIATTSATAVALVYRSPWNTMTEICRGLLDLGISFRTVIETAKAPKPAGYHRSQGLGLRPQRFSPSQEDYLSYQQARDRVLQSSSGRAFRLRGGLAGRIASECVPDLAVLDGPSLGNEVVGRHGDKYFVDDGISEQDSNVVMGVYRVELTDGRPATNPSWWPKIHSWEHNHGYHGDQWLPLAEKFYQGRLKELGEGVFKVHSGTEWKERYKFYRTTTKAIVEGSELLAAEFLGKSSRVR
jgi:hypothetical protein